MRTPHPHRAPLARALVRAWALTALSLVACASPHLAPRPSVDGRVAPARSDRDNAASRALATTSPAPVKSKSSPAPERPDGHSQIRSAQTEPSPPELPAPTRAEVDELLLAAQEGSAEDLLELMEQQARERRPWELEPTGPTLSGQGTNATGALDYDKTVQSALYHAYAIDPDGQAVGRPNQGHLEDGVPLPHAPDLYTIRRRHSSYASSHTALQVVTAFRLFREQSGYTGKILIADISDKDGGSYRTHHSHQTGRDLDILMPIRAGTHSWGHNIDWDTTWMLVRAFLDTEEVEYIFLDYKIQRHLHAAAVRAGEDPKALAHLISWPLGIWNKTIVRDSPGHWAHVHVRIKCGPTETRCRSFH